jgi:hypothetical protein
VTTDELVAMLKAYRAGVSSVWSRYLGEIQAMDPDGQPAIGSMWPSDGAFVPDGKTFQDSLAELAAVHLMASLLNVDDQP